MLQRAGGSLAGVEDGGVGAEERSVWHMWVACVCVCVNTCVVGVV